MAYIILLKQAIGSFYDLFRNLTMHLIHHLYTGLSLSIWTIKFFYDDKEPEQWLT